MSTSRTPPAQQQQSGDLLEHFQLSKMNNLWSPKKEERLAKKAGQVQVSGDFYQNFNFILLLACTAVASTNEANISSQNKGTYKAMGENEEAKKMSRNLFLCTQKIAFFWLALASERLVPFIDSQPLSLCFVGYTPCIEILCNAAKKEEGKMRRRETASPSAVHFQYIIPCTAST